ncbi:MAG: exo-alpha-sialidase [Actinomycetota bacterium]|nr:exo-alpha-sialidase [Actinomycetota bacterium]
MLALAGIYAGGCGEAESPLYTGPAVSGDPGPVHVHGLGINPSDGALFLATHTGLFRLPAGEEEAVRVADRYQDTMGFTVIGPDRFLGSGHPDGREDLPPFLGLIESSDAGGSWDPVSLLGDADFHALEARGSRVYGFGSDWETRESQFLVSSDGGESWDRKEFPVEFLSLAIHPNDADRIIGSGESAVYLSSDAGSSWRELDSTGGLVAWASPEELIMIDVQGSVWSSPDGMSWRQVGDVSGEPAAFEAEREALYVALHDGTITRSADGGRSWSVLSRPE